MVRVIQDRIDVAYHREIFDGAVPDKADKVDRRREILYYCGQKKFGPLSRVHSKPFKVTRGRVVWGGDVPAAGGLFGSWASGDRGQHSGVGPSHGNGLYRRGRRKAKIGKRQYTGRGIYGLAAVGTKMVALNELKKASLAEARKLIKKHNLPLYHGTGLFIPMLGTLADQIFKFAKQHLKGIKGLTKVGIRAAASAGGRVVGGILGGMAGAAVGTVEMPLVGTVAMGALGSQAGQLAGGVAGNALGGAIGDAIFGAD